MLRVFDIKKIKMVISTDVHEARSWFGKTKHLWIQLDCDPKSIPLHEVKKHIIIAYEKNEDFNCPRDYISAVVMI